MNAAIGKTAERLTGKNALARSRARAALIPDLLVEAHRVANSVFAGWHGRRQRGIGEDFWQFRPYVQGENFSAIDWRRSARDDHVYVRDREWQASHTIWLWVDESPSMLFASSDAITSKQSRALVLALAMADLLARSGERVGWLGLTPPILHRHASEHLAEALIHAEVQNSLPDTLSVKNYSELIVFSDFLDSDEERTNSFKNLARKHVRGHLVQIIDPAEEAFPYAGRVEFHDPETGKILNLGSAQNLREDYHALFKAHSKGLSDYTKRLGWSFTRHHTDQLASNALKALHLYLGRDHNDLAGGY